LAAHTNAMRLDPADTTTKAKPPPRGVGCRCELRALGWSRRRRDNLGIKARSRIQQDAAESARQIATGSSIKTNTRKRTTKLQRKED
jgi:hypothetical protein